MRRDSLISTKDRKIYEVVGTAAGDSYRCHEVVMDPWVPADPPLALPWELVGVWRHYSARGKISVVPKVDVTGKVVRCGRIYTEWQLEWLGSKYDKL